MLRLKILHNLHILLALAFLVLPLNNHSNAADKLLDFCQKTILGLKSANSVDDYFVQIFPGDSHAMITLRGLLLRYGQTDIPLPVLITGPSGVGKEVMGRIIHELSPRANGPYIAVNVTAVSSELLESEIFGHVKGAFTGASSDHDGFVQRAHNGTLLLDEIGDMPMAMQTKLLRFLQDGTFTKVGGQTEKRVNVRIISSTNKNLKKMMEEGKFRKDLYYRIATLPLRVPSLSERKDQLIHSIRLILSHMNESMAPDKQITITPAAIKVIEDHPLPGNYRQLLQVLQLAGVLSENRVITPAVLFFEDEEVNLATTQVRQPDLSTTSNTEFGHNFSAQLELLLNQYAKEHPNEPKKLTTLVKWIKIALVKWAIAETETHEEAAKYLTISPRSLRDIKNNKDNDRE